MFLIIVLEGVKMLYYEYELSYDLGQRSFHTLISLFVYSYPVQNSRIHDISYSLQYDMNVDDTV